MTGIELTGRALIALGVLLVVLGVFLTVGARLPFLGRLPGDIHLQVGGVTVFAPIATMLLVSLILTILANLLFRR